MECVYCQLCWPLPHPYCLLIALFSKFSSSSLHAWCDEKRKRENCLHLFLYSSPSRCKWGNYEWKRKPSDSKPPPPLLVSNCWAWVNINTNLTIIIATTIIIIVTIIIDAILAKLTAGDRYRSWWIIDGNKKSTGVNDVGEKWWVKEIPSGLSPRHRGKWMARPSYQGTFTHLSVCQTLWDLTNWRLTERYSTLKKPLVQN